MIKKESGTTRRDFVKAAAALAAAPLALTSRNRRAGAAPANDRIVMGIVGPGKQGLGLMKRFMRFPNTQMVAVCDVSRARRDYAKFIVEDRYIGAKDQGTFKSCAAYDDYRELLAREDIDAIICATPDHWHAAVCIDACKQGKDIYCEKPLSLTIHEATMMIKATRKYRRVFQTGSMQRSECGGRFHKACELVRNGRIGNVKEVYVNIGGTSKPCELPEQPKPEGLDWYQWLGPAPMRPFNEVLSPIGPPEKPKDGRGGKFYKHFPNWRNYREYSGGMMTDWGAHHFDIAQWGLDMDDSGPVEIIPPKGDEPLTYKYINGVVMKRQGEHEGERVRGVKFVGTDGWIMVDRGSFSCFPEDIDKDPIPENGIHLYKAPNGDHKLDFIQCIETRKRPICDVSIGAHSVTVCHIGNHAWWSGRKLKWDPMKWEYPGDAEANSWIDRERRDPFQLPEI